jgi:hypothetical protein
MTRQYSYHWTLRENRAKSCMGGQAYESTACFTGQHITLIDDQHDIHQQIASRTMED